LIYKKLPETLGSLINALKTGNSVQFDLTYQKLII